MRGLALLVVVAACSSGSVPAPASASAPAVADEPTPPPAAAGWPATLSLSSDNGCFTRGGQVLCWGDNEYGVLGDASARSRDEAAPVAGIAVAIDVAVLGS